MTTAEEKPYDGRLKRRRLKVGDPDFVPPDGGWGWLIIFACGFSNVIINLKILMQKRKLIYYFSSLVIFQCFNNLV